MRCNSSSFRDFFNFIQDCRMYKLESGVCYTWDCYCNPIYIRIIHQMSKEHPDQALVELFNKNSDGIENRLILIRLKSINNIEILRRADTVVIEYANGKSAVYPIGMNTVYQEWYYGDMQTNGGIDKSLASNIRDAVDHASREYIEKKHDEIEKSFNKESGASYLFERIEEIAKDMGISCFVTTGVNSTIINPSGNFCNVLDRVKEYHDKLFVFTDKGDTNFLDIYNACLHLLSNEENQVHLKPTRLRQLYTSDSLLQVILYSIDFQYDRNIMRFYHLDMDTYTPKEFMNFRFTCLTEPYINCGMVVTVSDIESGVIRTFDGLVSVDEYGLFEDPKYLVFKDSLKEMIHHLSYV